MRQQLTLCNFYVLLLLCSACGRGTHEASVKPPITSLADEIHVHPGDEIQSALDSAASRGIKTVVVHSGTYAPPEARQALVWFQRQHDGIHLRAEGRVTLTAANPNVANAERKSYPAVVNHVVYFGDGISNSTKMSGFVITGANNFVTTKKGPTIEPEADDSQLKKTVFFYTDGGAVKIFGKSYPVLENLHIVNNYASPNSGGVSIEHRGYTEDHAIVRDCVFRNNRSPLTGSAITLLDHEYGSSALIENCLFVDNRSNCLMDERSQQLGSWNSRSGHGAVTVFAFSKAEFRRCTFTGNRNGVDDLSQCSSYVDCIFWDNTVPGGWPEGESYDIRLSRREAVRNCFLSTNNFAIDPQGNMLEAPDPDFNKLFVPQNSIYLNAGYRPADVTASATESSHLSNSVEDNPDMMETLQIRVDGEEFGWNICYAGVDQQFDTPDDVVVRRHIYIPADVDIRIAVGSQDYLYQLALPKQSVKEVAIPGKVHRCTFVAKQPGVYPLVGDQFCGYTHPDLIGKLIVKSPREFQAWLNKQTQKK